MSLYKRRRATTLFRELLARMEVCLLDCGRDELVEGLELIVNIMEMDPLLWQAARLDVVNVLEEDDEKLRWARAMHRNMEEQARLMAMDSAGGVQ